MKWEQQTGIALALDVKDCQEAFVLLDEISSQVDVIKFNYPLILKEGISIMTEVKKRYQKPILADFKVADVPVTNNRIIRQCRDAGADGVMIHGFVGADALREAKEAADNLKLFLVTQLTNPGGLDFTAQFTQEFAQLARFLELGGVQAPGNRPEVVALVREIVGPELMIVCCGIGAQGGKFGHAIAAGADFEIIGRAIYAHDNPRKATDRIVKLISQKAGWA